MRLLPLVCCLPTALFAQELDRWSAGPVDVYDSRAWVTTQTVGSPLVTLGVHCAAGDSYLTLDWDGLDDTQRAADLTLTVGSRSTSIEGRYLFFSADPAWAAALDATWAERLMAGNTATVTLDGDSYSFGLSGSRRAISQALEGCGTGTGAQADWADYFAFRTRAADGSLIPVQSLAAETDWTLGAPLRPEDMPVAPEALAARAEALCPSARLGPGSVLAADFDADARADVVLNLAAVTCNGAPLCTDAQCGIEAYVSSLAEPLVVATEGFDTAEIIEVSGASRLRLVRGCDGPACEEIWGWQNGTMARWQ